MGDLVALAALSARPRCQQPAVHGDAQHLYYYLSICR